MGGEAKAPNNFHSENFHTDVVWPTAAISIPVDMGPTPRPLSPNLTSESLLFILRKVGELEVGV